MVTTNATTGIVNAGMMEVRKVSVVVNILVIQLVRISLVQGLEVGRIEKA